MCVFVPLPLGGRGLGAGVREKVRLRGAGEGGWQRNRKALFRAGESLPCECFLFFYC